MDVAAGNAELDPHLEAVRASVRAGFRFRHLPDADDVHALQGFRVLSGAMDVYLARAADDALAARYRLEDLQSPSPAALWHRQGTVAEVVTALLELPEHGTPKAPKLAHARPEGLWVPHRANP
ncbi:hypothetical protein HUO13_00380 [Saccharopolyspora erythraea]|uniref:hypothetical protein n=1 Tax=Saccharopolyspora erythraea TaxID=1836 RepID=UPI001BABFF6B|nr:hypothetical protein [Saccharopolyspora erythraea]QUG99463.1 hypothetical protein HUO13_00380 [Saccharopolyspora erythraea]